MTTKELKAKLNYYSKKNNVSEAMLTVSGYLKRVKNKQVPLTEIKKIFDEFFVKEGTKSPGGRVLTELEKRGYLKEI